MMQARRHGWPRAAWLALSPWGLACHVAVGTYAEEESAPESSWRDAAVDGEPAAGAGGLGGVGQGRPESAAGDEPGGDGPRPSAIDDPQSPHEPDAGGARPAPLDSSAAGAPAPGPLDEAGSPAVDSHATRPSEDAGASADAAAVPPPPRPRAALDVPYSFPPPCDDTAACADTEQCRGGTCAPATCGDGQPDPGEECDDGDERDSDGCELDCTSTRVLDVEVAGTTACALLSAGRVKCWGRDDGPLLARGRTGQVFADPAQLEPLDFGTSRRVAQLSAGQDHYCVLFEDGFARCWGGNALGQLGTGTTDDYGDSSDETLAALADLPVGGMAQISAGRQHTCALRALNPEAPAVICWGNSDSGPLGIGFVEGPVLAPSPSRAVELAGAVVTRIRAGSSATCTLLASGDVLCWGNNSSNGLAGAGSTYAPDPARHALRLGSGPQDISGGFCLFGPPSELFCWGSNADARLGTPLLAGEPIRAPVRIQIGDRRFVSFQVQGDHGCGLTEQGRVLCFGRGVDADLGYAGRYDPTLHARENWDRLPNAGAVDLGDYDAEPGLDRVEQLFVAPNLNCAQMNDATLRCWGSNGSARLGYGYVNDTAEEALANLGDIGDDETPAEAYLRLGRPNVRLW